MENNKEARRARTWELFKHFAEGVVVLAGSPMEKEEHVLVQEVLPMSEQMEKDLQNLSKWIFQCGSTEDGKCFDRIRAAFGGEG